jgi:formamidopyrimidine-DNA glycosylase
MPELPEVQTTTNGLSRVLVGKSIVSVWTDLAKKNQSVLHYKTTLKDYSFYTSFSKIVCGTKVISVQRKAKNILINLSNGYTILVHMKMTGHIMYGLYAYDKRNNTWKPDEKEKNQALRDPYNRFIHVVFELSDKKHIVLCDARKFATVSLLKTEGVELKKYLEKLGPEPLTVSYSLFKEQLLKKQKTPIKTVLMDQTILSGIGNIYSDEILYLASVHPLSISTRIPEDTMKKMYEGMKKVLTEGIQFGGDSTSDYRNIEGKPGAFQYVHKVYRQTHKKCPKNNCRGIITRMVVNTRSAHFCSLHQKLYV